MNDIPEPAAAPAVDDELLRDLAFAVGHEASRMPTMDGTSRLLASEPMQRLRAAWTAEAECDHWSMSGDEGPVKDLAGGIVVRFRCDGCGAKVYDDAALERLRAAQQLPDVGPARRSRRFIEVDGHSYADDYGPGDFRLRAARLLAVAAFLDAEAADTSSDDDDPDEALARKLKVEYATGPDIGRWVRVAAMARDELLRARGGQEAGRDR